VGGNVWRRRGREGSRPIVKYLLKNLGDETKERIILSDIIIFKDLKYSINKKYRVTV
jgi:hypothetical protein